MDATTFRETVESETATELGRLGSSKLLVALTDATLDRASVLRAAADSEHAARETFRAWADDEDDERARALFAATAEREADHYDRVLAALDADHDPADGGPLHEYLRGRTDTVERVAAGVVGRGLVSARTHTQVIGFFVNEPDRERADLFRELKADTEAATEEGLELLADLAETEDDWERARAVATYAIQVAYDDYADALRGLGVDPRPIC
jgi:hypothetical protein